MTSLHKITGKSASARELLQVYQTQKLFKKLFSIDEMCEKGYFDDVCVYELALFLILWYYVGNLLCFEILSSRTTLPLNLEVQCTSVSKLFIHLFFL